MNWPTRSDCGTARAPHRSFSGISSSTEKGLAALRPHEAAEILLVARWFKLNPKELKRTTLPKEWLADYAGPTPKTGPTAASTDDISSTAPSGGSVTRLTTMVAMNPAANPGIIS